MPSGDFYSAFISPLFPVFMDKVGLSLAEVGLLAGIFRFLMFIVQPMSGYWADRHPSRSFILIVMVARALVGQSLMTFMPVFWVQKGHTIISAGILFSIFTISGMVAGIHCGHLSDRMGYKRLFWITHGLMAPFLLLFLLAPGKWIYLATRLSFIVFTKLIRPRIFSL